MCSNPSKLPNGQMFACRKCGLCRNRYIEDWVGRCIAESKTASATSVVTLTYGDSQWEEGDGSAEPASHYRDGRDISEDQKIQARLLAYADVQRYFKRLRKAKFEFKFFVVGEYGSKKGRAHWHVLFFWRDGFPKHPVRMNFRDPFWKHGWSFWDDGIDANSVRYVCKYLQKDTSPEEMARQGLLSMSKLPPIGSDYFELLAQRYVEAQLAPQDLFYRFPEVLNPNNGKPKDFMLGRASARNFISAYIRRWQLAYGKRFLPASPVVEEFLDKLNKREALTLNAFRRAPDKPWFVPDWWYRSPNHAPWFDDARNCWYVERMNGERLYWSFDDEGRRAWLDVIRTEPNEVREVSKSRVSGYNEYSGRKDGTLYETRRTRH